VTATQAPHAELRRWPVGRILSGALALAFAAAVSACGSQPSSTNTSSQTPFILPATNGAYMDLDKTIYNHPTGALLVQLPLVILNQNSQPIGGAATSWSVSPNHLVWTFHLNPKLVWSTGQPLTAQDYVVGAQYTAAPSTGYDFGWWWSSIAQIKNYVPITEGKLPPSALGVKALNAHTLQVTTTVPVPYLPLAMGYLTPEPPWLLDKYGAAWSTNPKTMAFTGPYVISKWVPNQYIVFTPNPRYYGPYAHQGPAKIIAELDGGADYTGFLDGQVDETVLNAGEYNAALKSPPPGSHLVNIPFWWINMLGFNQTKPPFNSVLVRRAISLAINKTVLVNDVLKGLARPITSVVPADFPGYDPNITEPYNPALARRLLAEAGYPGGKGFPVVTLEIRNEAATIDATLPAAEFIQSELKNNLGITIRVKVLDISPYNYDYIDPSDWYSLFLPGGVMTWQNSQFDTLVNEANSSFNNTQRLQLYNQAAQILNQQVGAVFLWSYVGHYLVSNKVEGFPTTPIITYTDFWMDWLHMK
jgi:oligopeptide transport system substrate-binding protein